MSRDRLSQARCRRPGLPATVDAIAGSPRFRRGPADQPDATVTTDAGTFRAVVFGQRPVEDAVGSADLRLDGNADATSRLRGLLLTLCRQQGRRGAGVACI